LTVVVAEIVPHLKMPTLGKADIRSNLAPKLPSIRANLLQMRLVVLNLIINAIEALGGERGSITITTAPVELRGDPAEGDWHDLPDGLYVRLEVSDTGRGMTNEAPEHVFDPCYSAKFIGRGSGLATVQGIIRAHNGAIHASSAPGDRSRIEVLLPNAR
jgi:nitrogen-specific signal transduction histidine kinase